MSTKTMYTFIGLKPFMERAGAGRPLPHLGRFGELWHCRQIQDALGQLPRLDPEARRQLLAHARSIRDALAVTVEGIDLAIRETAEATDRADAAEPANSRPRTKRS